MGVCAGADSLLATGSWTESTSCICLSSELLLYIVRCESESAPNPLHTLRFHSRPVSCAITSAGDSAVWVWTLTSTGHLHRVRVREQLKRKRGSGIVDIGPSVSIVGFLPRAQKIWAFGEDIIVSGRGGWWKVLGTSIEKQPEKLFITCIGAGTEGPLQFGSRGKLHRNGQVYSISSIFEIVLIGTRFVIDSGGRFHELFGEETRTLPPLLPGGISVSAAVEVDSGSICLVANSELLVIQFGGEDGFDISKCLSMHVIRSISHVSGDTVAVLLRSGELKVVNVALASSPALTGSPTELMEQIDESHAVLRNLKAADKEIDYLQELANRVVATVNSPSSIAFASRPRIVRLSGGNCQLQVQFALGALALQLLRFPSERLTVEITFEYAPNQCKSIRCRVQDLHGVIHALPLKSSDLILSVSMSVSLLFDTTNMSTGSDGAKAPEGSLYTFNLLDLELSAFDFSYHCAEELSNVSTSTYEFMGLTRDPFNDRVPTTLSVSMGFPMWLANPVDPLETMIRLLGLDISTCERTQHGVLTTLLASDLTKFPVKLKVSVVSHLDTPIRVVVILKCLCLKDAVVFRVSLLTRLTHFTELTGQTLDTKIQRPEIERYWEETFLTETVPTVQKRARDILDSDAWRGIKDQIEVIKRKSEMSGDCTTDLLKLRKRLHEMYQRVREDITFPI